MIFDSLLLLCTKLFHQNDDGFLIGIFEISFCTGDYNTRLYGLGVNQLNNSVGFSGKGSFVEYFDYHQLPIFASSTKRYFQTISNLRTGFFQRSFTKKTTTIL